MNAHRYRLILLIIALTLAACGQQTAAPDGDLPSAANKVDAPTPSFWQTAALPYRGLVLRGITEDSPPSLYIRDVLAPAFAQETGIEIKLEISANPTIEGLINAGTAEYDFVYVEQDVIYGYLAQQRLTNLTQLQQTNVALVAPDFNPEDFIDLIDAFRDPASGDLYGIPIEAFIKVYLYRKDLFEDPTIKAAFAAEHHYPLAPAVTFTQYHDIALFFTRYGQTHNLPLWGTTLQASDNSVASFYEFVETIAPSFGVYDWGINLATYRATVANGGQLDSDLAVRALTYWLDLLPLAPPTATGSDWTAVAASFGRGEAAQGWVYGEHVAWLATDAARSQVVGKVGVALPPTGPGVIEDAAIGAGYLGYYDGAAFGIPARSANPAATLLWLQYLGQPAVQPAWAVNSGRIVHLATFDDPLVQVQNTRLNGYYTLMKKQGHLLAGAPPFAFHTAVRDVIAPFIYQAIGGELTPTAALQGAALAADAELVRLGYGR
ncbi:MAG: extracellular solute-binding protein [Chloroflexota bacterium]|nr:extracellular solute-binding protein [Chloroflexota bacterium]